MNNIKLFLSALIRKNLKMSRWILGFLLLNSLLISQLNAHSGRLNSQGCHAGSKPYHCHRSSSEMAPSSSGGFKLKCFLGSKSKDCTTSKN